MDGTTQPLALEYEPLRRPPRSRTADLTMAGLTLSTTALAGIMLQKGLTTWLEAISFVTGAVCVWLTVVESTWNFPIGLANSATFVVVFYRARLFADTSLNIIYFVLGVIGWYMWLFGGENRTRLHITRAAPDRLIRVGLAILAMWIAMFFVLKKVQDSAPVLDALTTAMSLGAQWLLDRKHIENWIVWIIADLIYVPLYSYQHLYLTAVLYAVFVCMAILGLLAWQKTWRSEQLAVPA
jgi:nicotinamide mononucleotide transporter